MKTEFDEYIDGYRSNCDKFLKLSGETSAYFAEYKAQKLAEWFPHQTRSSINILDFGCGDGTMTHFVKRYFPKSQVFGMDPSPKSIAEAKSHFPGITFLVSSDEHTQLGIEDGFFDIIFSAGVFHHIPFSMHEGYIQELMKKLKPGGRLIIFELNPLNPLTVLIFKRNPIDRNAKMMWPWYTDQLTQRYGKSCTKFYCFYPRVLSWLRPTEPYLTKLPLGALYATIVEKPKSPENYPFKT